MIIMRLETLDLDVYFLDNLQHPSESYVNRQTLDYIPDPKCSRRSRSRYLEALKV